MDSVERVNKAIDELIEEFKLRKDYFFLMKTISIMFFIVNYLNWEI